MKVAKIETVTNELSRVEATLETRRKLSGCYILVNDLLPQYDAINSRFTELGLEISDTFGSSSNEPHVPSTFSLAFGEELEIEAMQELLRICSGFGVETLELSGETFHQQQIYVGSYGYEFEPVAELTPALKDKLLATGISKAAFYRLIEQNSTSARVIPFKKLPVPTVES